MSSSSAGVTYKRVLVAYTEHYNRARPHRALGLQPPDRESEPAAAEGIRIRKQDVLGGLIHEYERVAA